MCSTNQMKVFPNHFVDVPNVVVLFASKVLPHLDFKNLPKTRVHNKHQSQYSTLHNG